MGQRQLVGSHPAMKMRANGSHQHDLPQSAPLLLLEPAEGAQASTG